MTARPDGMAGAVGGSPIVEYRSLPAALGIVGMFALFGLALMAPPALASELSPAEARGQRIYTTGESASSRIIKAYVRYGAPPVPSSTVPCVRCHGADGQGTDEEEAATLVPDINWSVLTGPDDHVHPKRRHAPFDETSFTELITAGNDPDGNRLDTAMPRYEMAEADILDLIAYLKSIDQVPDPGLEDARLRIGTVLPLAGTLASEGQAIRRLLEKYVNSVNAAGGIHGRMLELVVAGYGENDDPAIWQARDLVSAEPVFALVSTYLPGYDREIVRLAEDEEIPLVGPYTVMPAAGQNRRTFYVLAGLPQQAQSLVDSVELMGDEPARRVAIVSPRLVGFDRIGNDVVASAESRGLEVTDQLSYTFGQFDADAAAGRLNNSGADAVIFLGAADDFERFAKAAAGLDWFPHLLAPGSLVESALQSIPGGFSGRLTLAYGWTPADRALPDSEDEDALIPRNLDYDRLRPAEIAAFSAMTVLIESLERAGRNVDREKLILTLENLDNFHPGLTPAVSFGADRRLGNRGAWNVLIELGERPAAVSANWVELD